MQQLTVSLRYINLAEHNNRCWLLDLYETIERLCPHLQGELCSSLSVCLTLVLSPLQAQVHLQHSMCGSRGCSQATPQFMSETAECSRGPFAAYRHRTSPPMLPAAARPASGSHA